MVEPEREATRLQHGGLVAAANLEASLEHMDGLLLDVMNVEGWPALRGNLHDEVIEQAACVLSGQLEDQVAARA